MVSKKPDFKKVNILANQILIMSNSFASFPVSPKTIVKECSDIEIRSFRVAHLLGVDIEAFGSESAVLICKNGRYIIFYNQDDYAPRVRFSILHEFAHYLLGHKFGKYNENDEQYVRQEIEANYFAAQLLMPEQVLNELKKRGARISKEFLKKHFGVSEEAAIKRIETLGKVNYEWRSDDEKFFDETIGFKFSRFLDSVLPKRNQYSYFEDDLERQKERDTWRFNEGKRYRY